MRALERLLFVTGRPGVGKTTLILKIADELREEGYAVGGMITREVREEGRRTGFEIIDLLSNKRDFLAHINQPSGPRVGKYRVNLVALSLIGAWSIRRALEKADVIVIDEVGPMELNSEEFKSAVKKALDSSKLVIGTIHYRISSSLIKEISSREDTLIFKINLKNRGYLHRVILDKAFLFLRESEVKKGDSLC